jgi:hypothetical protein
MMRFITPQDYFAEKAAHNLTIQHTVAISMDGVRPDAVTDIVVTDAAGSVVQRSERASVTDSCRLSYTITVHDPQLTYDVLRYQLIEAARAGAMDENMHMYAAEFGADNLAHGTLSAPVVRNAADDESGDEEKLSAGEIAGLVIGSFAGGCLVVATLWWFVEHRIQRHHEAKVSTSAKKLLIAIFNL